MNIILILSMLVGVSFFDIRIEMHDELNLFNPVYTYLHYGKMTFPSQGFFERFFAHPPVHYLEIASFMKAGVPFFYAWILPVILLSLLCILLILNAPFELHEKFALLFGLSVPLLYGVFTVNYQSLRPDYAVALAWFGGLISFEAGRIKHWHRGWLFLGAFLLTCASGLHYWAISAWTGIAIYFFLSKKEVNGRYFNRAAMAMVAGALLFGVPYLVLFLIPNIEEIIPFAISNNNKWSDGGISYAIFRHMEAYRQLSNSFPALQPFPWLKLTIAIPAAVILFFHRNLKWMGITALPLTLFIFLVSKSKSNGYYIPEIMLFYTALPLLFHALLKKLSRKITTRWFNLSFGILFSLLFVKEWMVNWRHDFHFTRLGSEQPIARACARKMVGENAIIGSRLNLWYISGAQHWYNIENEVVAPDDISNLDIEAYFSHFDFIAEHNAGANLTFNRQLKTVSSWFADSILHLHGFYLSDNNTWYSDLAMVFLKTAPRSCKLEGYGCRGYFDVFHFEECDTGSYMFTVFRVPNDSSYVPLAKSALLANIIPLPDPEGGINQMGWQAKENLLVCVHRMQLLQDLLSDFTGYYAIREQKPVKKEKVNRQELLDWLERTDKTIIFYKNLKELPPTGI